MSGNSILLDTNIIIALFNGEKGIAEKLDKLKQVYVPAVVVGELFYGAFSSTSKSKNISRINSFLTDCQVLDVDQSTAKLYGELKSILRKNGTPIPENDIWIAATAVQHDLKIATRDAHFKNLSKLTIVSL